MFLKYYVPTLISVTLVTGKMRETVQTLHTLGKLFWDKNVVNIQGKFEDKI